MSLEERVADAFGRRADDVQPRVGARVAFERNVERAYRRRAVASSVLGVAILTTIGLAAASLPRALQDQPSLFTSPSSVSSFRFETRMVDPSRGADTAMTMSGESDLVAGRTKVTTSQIAGQEVVTITDGDLVYMRAPTPVDGKRWIRAKVEPFFQAFQSMPFLSQDPVQFFDDLNRHAIDVEQTGTARVRGVQTTEYRAAIDAKRLFEPVIDGIEQMMRRMADRYSDPQSGLPSSFSGPDENEIAEAIRMMRQAIPDTLDVTIWIGGDQLPRRLEMEIPPLSPETTQSIVVTTDYFDYNAPLTIELPPASVVKDVDSLFDFFLPSSIGSESVSECVMVAPNGGEPMPCES